MDNTHRTVYDEDDPWHSNANLIFGFGCYHCPAWIDMNWEWASDAGDAGFLGACVEVWQRAKQGWILIEEWRFLMSLVISQLYLSISRLAGYGYTTATVAMRKRAERAGDR